MKPIHNPRMNKRVTDIHFTDEELRLIQKYAGKIPVSEIVDKVNEISNTVRTERAIRQKGGKQGFTFGLK